MAEMDIPAIAPEERVEEGFWDALDESEEVEPGAPGFVELFGVVAHP